MLIIVPMMFFTTIAMTIMFISQISSEELDSRKALANDFSMIHEYRVEYIEAQDVTDGEVTVAPGYPFQPYYNYYTEVVDMEDYVATLTWPETPASGIYLPENKKDLLRIVEARLHRGFYAGNWIDADEEGSGRVSHFDITGLDKQPQDGDPVLIKVTFHGAS